MGSKLQNVKVSRDESAWEAEIVAEIPADVLATYREQSLKEIQKDAKLDGFRPGHAPIERIIAVYGEGQVMRRAAEMAIQNELPELLAKEQVAIVEAPRVTTDTPESGKSLTFTARAALAPKIELADYAAIAAKQREVKEDTSVSDEEHKEALTHLRRERARIDKMEAGAEPAKAAEEVKTMKEEELPALDDTFVQSLGYESAAAFSDLVRKNIQTEKELRASEKRRTAILDELVGNSKISYPASLREYELDDMEARVKSDLARYQQTFEKYLEEIKKTREELRESWKEAADKRAKVRLILGEIARRESVEPDAEALAKEVAHAKEHYKDVDEHTLRAHIAHAMRNEATLKFIETGDKTPPPPKAHDHAH
jgi:FKBP-type peptidyl-prolyl cis-trans isomerase (trigger factor)